MDINGGISYFKMEYSYSKNDSNNEIYYKRSAGEGIRTLEGLRQRILSPPPLTAWVPLQSYYGFAVPLKRTFP